MKNRHKLRRCVDFLNRRKDEVLKIFTNKKPTDKEKVLLNYLNTLKKKLLEKYKCIQFIEYFIDEYGNKRNLMSSIIQIYFPFDKGNSYKDIYMLVKNYFVYEIVLQTHMSYVLLPSASLLFGWKIADCFDLCNLTVSCLRTKNYEAYVVCGEAPLAICAKNDVTIKNGKIHKRNFCQLHLKTIKEDNEDEEAKEINDKKEKYKRLLNINRYLYNFTEWETSGKRNYKKTDCYIHAWVLIKKSLDVENDIFIEVSTGIEYSTEKSPYKAIYFLWNDKNIYINTKLTEKVARVISKMKNSDFVVPAFYEEIKSKTLTPVIEANYFHIRKDRYLLKFPYGSNTTFYENCKKDEYGHHLQRDGLSEHHIHFITKNSVSVEYTCSFYKNRRDNKTAKIYIPQRYKTIEYYDNCSYQFLKKIERKTGFYTYYVFYPNRVDGLFQYLEIHGYKIMEYFKNRRDKIIYRSLRLSKDETSEYILKGCEGNEYYVEKITVKYMPNEETDNPIYKKIFELPEKRITLRFYNVHNKIRDVCEVYEKQTIYNADREEEEEILVFKKNTVYEHLVNREKPLNEDVTYLLNEEKDFFEDIKRNYENIICAILEKKKLAAKEEERQRYLSANITNMSEIVYHNNEKSYDLDTDILDDNVNIYDFNETYPWIENSEINLQNSFFKSMDNLVTVKNAENNLLTTNDANVNITQTDKQEPTDATKDQTSEEKIDQFTTEGETSVNKVDKSSEPAASLSINVEDIKQSILKERLETYEKRLLDLNNANCNDAETMKTIEDINKSIKITKERLEKYRERT